MASNSRSEDRSYVCAACSTRIQLIQCAYTWEIKKFKSKRGLHTLKFSPEADWDESKWQILLYPKGNTTDHKGFVSIYLEALTPMNVNTEVKFSILDKQGKKMYERSTVNIFSKVRKVHGHNRFIIREDLLAKNSGLLFNDTLIIYCELSLSKLSCQPEVVEGDINAHKLLITEPVFSDVYLCVDGKEIRVNKSVLAANSRVFYSMFDNPARERINVNDVSSDVLQEMVTYMYTGWAPNLHSMAIDLLKASEKYRLTSLKTVCEKFLSKYLAITNVPKLLVLAEQNSAEILKSRVVAFIAKNINQVINTDEWKAEVRDHPHLQRRVMVSMGEIIIDNQK